MQSPLLFLFLCKNTKTSEDHGKPISYTQRTSIKSNHAEPIPIPNTAYTYDILYICIVTYDT